MTDKRQTKTAAQRAQDEVDVLTRRVARYRDAQAKAARRRDDLKAKYEPLIQDATAEVDGYTQPIDDALAELEHAKAHPALRQGGQEAGAGADV